ncbi:selenocysteine lyase isoform X2 [Ambystoma mexicanum]|uniref:selenocysteine lyase isoform X2 n=1 Tax=Ambystoma mexicanum TaxID=8296 RepID=UPI0037E7FA3B
MEHIKGGDQSSDERKVYMDYNATTPLEPKVIQAVTEAMTEAWGNPSSSYVAGLNAKEIIDLSRGNVAMMVGGKPDDIIFTSGGTEANNLVFHSAVRYFKEFQELKQDVPDHDYSGLVSSKPHFITSNIEHDSVRLPLEQLVKEQVAEATFVQVSKVSGRAEVDDVIAAIRPNTCLVSIMMANNETGVLMPISELSCLVKPLNQKRLKCGLPRILVHTDAAQAIGKVQVDVQELGVDYLTIVGHKFYAPRIGALYAQSPGITTPLHPMLFGGGQERTFRPGTENTPMIAGLGKAAEMVSQHCKEYELHLRSIRNYLEEQLQAGFGQHRIHFNSHFPGSQHLPNTCNVSILGPKLQGQAVLARCHNLLASVGAACHSDKSNRPSPILLNSGIPHDVACNALRLSVGRETTKEDVDLIIKDLKQAVAELEEKQHFLGNESSETHLHVGCISNLNQIEA